MLSHLQADRIRAAELDSQITALERSLSALRVQKTLVQGRLNSYKYPVLDLPNEIVSEIFIHFLPVYPKCPPSAGILSPTNLTHICRKWREIASATPMLWRASALPLRPSLSFAQQAGETDHWLRRSRSCPISIEIVEDYCEATKPDGWASEVLAVLDAHRGRWEHLKLHFGAVPPLITFERSMPLLRHLSLAFDEIHHHSSFPVVFGKTPLLRSVSLNYLATREVILPWAQLTSLELVSVFPKDCVAVLQQTFNLVHCQLTLFESRDMDLLDVTLPRLETLRLLGFMNHRAIGYLGTFFVPALRELRIPEQFLENPIEFLTSFISKSGCHLREVHITGERTVPKQTYCTTFPSIRFHFHPRHVHQISNGESSETEAGSSSDSSDNF
ncbi:hypothetical protein C8F04DRAFT_331298 [Mycena alexandri]|uniref:F-box domain-containing protein n=1 Tax=Mycena alexandri TaxID=1745969 RepID=A0AAD6T5M6_9AGAR|nr:hypothetical protein C8F04DRAFT_331298 [Mycena alexandri]